MQVQFVILLVILGNIFAVEGNSTILSSNEQVSNSSIQANYFICQNDKDINGTVYSENLEVYVTGCEGFNNPNARCSLKKGQKDPILTIKFKATKTVAELERVIIAKVPVQLSDSKIEMPYGPAVSPCANSSMIDQDKAECVDEGVVAGKSYTYTSTFKVMPSFPSVENIETKIILRKALKKHKKLRKYKSHPGPIVFCFAIPNIDVID